MRFSRPTLSTEEDSHQRILQAAQTLFAKQGFNRTTVKDIAERAKVPEGAIFRQFSTKKNLLVLVATQGWTELLTDLLTELSGMDNYRAVAQVMRKRMQHLHHNHELMKVCLMELQFHDDLRQQVQAEIVDKMLDVAEAFFETAIHRGIYRSINPKVIARVFLGMFMITGFSQDTIVSPISPLEIHEMAEGIADIFLHGVVDPTHSSSH